MRLRVTAFHRNRLDDPSTFVFATHPDEALRNEDAELIVVRGAAKRALPDFRGAFVFAESHLNAREHSLGFGEVRVEFDRARDFRSCREEIPLEKQRRPQQEVRLGPVGSLIDRLAQVALRVVEAPFRKRELAGDQERLGVRRFLRNHGVENGSARDRRVGVAFAESGVDQELGLPQFRGRVIRLRLERLFDRGQRASGIAALTAVSGQDQIGIGIRGIRRRGLGDHVVGLFRFTARVVETGERVGQFARVVFALDAVAQERFCFVRTIPRNQKVGEDGIRRHALVRFSELQAFSVGRLSFSVPRTVDRQKTCERGLRRKTSLDLGELLEQRLCGFSVSALTVKVREQQ